MYDFVNRDGYRRCSLKEFLEGRPYESSESISTVRGIRAASKRMEQVLRDSRLRRYALVDWNCEHVAHNVVTGHSDSRQVKAVGFAAVLATGLFVISSSAG